MEQVEVGELEAVAQAAEVIEHEVRLMAELDVAQTFVRQADPCGAVEQLACHHAVAGVAQKARFQLEDGLGTAAKIFRATETETVRLHRARVHAHGRAAGRTAFQVVDVGHALVNAAVQRHIALRGSRTGQAHRHHGEQCLPHVCFLRWPGCRAPSVVIARLLADRYRSFHL